MGKSLDGRAPLPFGCTLPTPAITRFQGAQEGRLRRGGQQAGAPRQEASLRTPGALGRAWGGGGRTARPGGPDRYRLLHSRRVQVRLLVASGGERDGRGARGPVNRNGLQP